jgi:hypothetical protein
MPFVFAIQAVLRSGARALWALITRKNGGDGNPLADLLNQVST